MLEVHQIVKVSEVFDALKIRFLVFVVEQQVPVELEMDEFDSDAVHFLATVDGRPAGTLRVRLIDGLYGKVQRVAVLKEYRNQYLVGPALMASAESYVATHDVDVVALDAQLTARSFYLRQGYDPDGEVFQEAGIDHIHMTKTL